MNKINKKNKKRSSKKKNLQDKKKLSSIVFKITFKFLEKMLIILKLIEIIKNLLA